MMIPRVFILLSLYLATSSCGSGKDYSDVFILDVSPRKAAIVPTPRQSCVDRYTPLNGAVTELPQSVGSESVGFSAFGLSWKDATRDLYIVKIQLDLSDSVVASSKEIADPQEIGTLFGVGQRTDVKIPRAGDIAGGATANSANLYRSDLKDFDANGEMDDGQFSCALAFGGFSLPKNIAAEATGLIRVVAIAQDDAGNQEIVRSTVPVSVIIDTQ